MAKKNDMIVAGTDCQGCKYLKLDGNSVYCFAKNKKYFYGQYTPCDNREVEGKK